VADVHLQRGERLGRWLARPQVVDDPVGRHDVAAGSDQPREDRPLARSAERGRSPPTRTCTAPRTSTCTGAGAVVGAGGAGGTGHPAPGRGAAERLPANRRQGCRPARQSSR
jgi:hypothetical protein